MFGMGADLQRIYTDRLLLREPKFSDTTDIFAFCSDPASSKYADWYPHSDKKETRDYISWIKKRAYKTGSSSKTWVMELKSEQKVIGTISLVETDYSGKIATVGYTLSGEYQHKGYATEALNGLLGYLFYDLQMERAQAKVLPANEPSVRLLERVGMKNEGLLRKGAFLKTECVDVYIYGLTAKEYKTLKNRSHSYSG